MSYTPNRITKKDPFTDEIEIDTNALQRNFDLLAQDSNELDAKITENANVVARADSILKKQTRFVNSFLFG